MFSDTNPFADTVHKTLTDKRRVDTTVQENGATDSVVPTEEPTAVVVAVVDAAADDAAGVQRLAAENVVLRHRLDDADRIVTHTLVEIHHDVTHDRLETGLRDLRDIVIRQAHQLVALRKHGGELSAAVRDVRAKMTVLTDANIELKRTNEALQAAHEKDGECKAHEVKSLRDLAEERATKIAHIEKKRLKAEHKYQREVRELKSQVSTLTAALIVEKSAVDLVRYDRDKASDELVRISEGTRKLLQKLDLGNDYDNIKVSAAVEHARNSVYNRPRRASKAPFRTSENHGENESADGARYSMPTVSGALTQLTIANSVTENNPKTISTDDILGQVATINRQVIVTELDENATVKLSKCTVCRKIFALNSNFHGACLYHVNGAMKLNEGTAMEIWSCCKSIDTSKGCVKARHTAELTY